MTAITATNSATPSVQSDLLRSRMAAARREVEQAESRARSLRRQVDAQENEVQQGRRQLKTVEDSALASASDNGKSAIPDTQADPTYTNALAEVFHAAKPILESGLSPLQKNIVESDALERTSKAMAASQTTPPSPTPYQSRAFQSPSQVIGRVLDAIA